MPIDNKQLAAAVNRRREEIGMSRRELARQAHVADMSRLENGLVSPRTDTLLAIAAALDMPVSELLGEPAELPSFAPYLRRKYGALPKEATQELEAYFTDLAAKYGLTPDIVEGPKSGEDEH